MSLSEKNFLVLRMLRKLSSIVLSEETISGDSFGLHKYQFDLQKFLLEVYPNGQSQQLFSALFWVFKALVDAKQFRYSRAYS